jgi:hypothetical protein
MRRTPELLAILLSCGGLLGLGSVRAQLSATADPTGQPHAIIRYDGDLTEFPRYQSAEQYSVEIPDAHRSRLTRGDVSRCTSRNGATVWTFPLPPGTTATLRHLPGRIEITFDSETGPSVAAAATPAPDPDVAAPLVTTDADGSALPPDRSEPIFPPPFVMAQASVEGAATDASTPQDDVAATTLISRAGRELTGTTLRDESIALADFALDVPDSPAFAVLGLSPETAVRPSNPQELIASVINGVDRNGNFQTGLAIDTVPYLLLFGPDVTLVDYQSSYITRLLTRAQLSIATSKGVEAEDKATRLAVGLHLTLLDRGDPRFDVDLQSTYAAISEQLDSGPIPPGPGMAQEAERRTQELRPLFKAAFEAARRRNWNRSNWSIGAAPSWISPSGDTEEFRWNGITVWNSFAYGFEGVPVLERSSQLIVHARYRSREEVPDPEAEGKFMRQDSFLAGARLRIGSVDTNLAFDGAYIREWGERGDRNAYRVSAALERRMTKNLWLSISAGQEIGSDDGKNALLILGNFKLGYGDGPAAPIPIPTTATPVVYRSESQGATTTSGTSVLKETPTPVGTSSAGTSTVVTKTPRANLSAPVRTLPSVPAEEQPSSDNGVPRKTTRPQLQRAVKKLPPLPPEDAGGGAVRKAPRPTLSQPIQKLEPQE